jgi:diacylglycerol kinase (ATP)
MVTAQVPRLAIVRGIGGAGRGRAARSAANQVRAIARANGWATTTVALDELASGLGLRGDRHTAASRHGSDDHDGPADRMRPGVGDHDGFGFERVVLCGGDGLVHRAIQVLAGSGVEVAIVPVGTGNDFARAFGIEGAHRGREAVALAAALPGGPAAAVDLLRATPFRTTDADTADAGSRVAASVVTAGFSGRVTATANAMRFPPGGSRYTVAALREIGRLRPRPFRLTLTNPATDADGRNPATDSDACDRNSLPDVGDRHRAPAPGTHNDPSSGDPSNGGHTTTIDGEMTMFACANTAWFGGGMQICPDADPFDGLLDVVWVGPVTRLTFVRWLPKVFRGTHLAHPAANAYRAAAVTVETSEALWADGEPFIPANTPTRIDIARAALRLVTPPSRVTVPIPTPTPWVTRAVAQH